MALQAIKLLQEQQQQRSLQKACDAAMAAAGPPRSQLPQSGVLLGSQLMSSAADLPPEVPYLPAVVNTPVFAVFHV